MRKKDLGELSAGNKRAFKTIQKPVELKPWESPIYGPITTNIADTQLQSNYGAITEQSQSERGAITEQLQSNSPLSLQSKNESEFSLQSNYRADQGAITEQLQSKNERKPISFFDLTGNEKQVVEFVFRACSIEGSMVSPRLSVTDFIEHLGFNDKGVKKARNHVQNIIKRIVAKGHLTREMAKKGNGGWIQLKLNKQVHLELLNHQLPKPITEQLQSPSQSNYRADQGANVSSSSSYLNNTTTNYQAPALETFNFKIPEELKKIGFSENHLMQLKRDSKLPPELILASLEALAYDLTFEDVKKKIRSPIGLIMKLLKASEPYLSEKGHEPEEDRLFRECIVRAEKHKIEKDKLKEKFLDLKFEQWLEPMADEELLKIVQPVGKLKGQFHLQQLKDHFKNEIFNGLNN